MGTHPRRVRLVVFCGAYRAGRHDAASGATRLRRICPADTLSVAAGGLVVIGVSGTTYGVDTHYVHVRYNDCRRNLLRTTWKRTARKAVLFAYGKSALYPMTEGSLFDILETRISSIKLIHSGQINTGGTK